MAGALGVPCVIRVPPRAGNARVRGANETPLDRKEVRAARREGREGLSHAPTAAEVAKQEQMRLVDFSFSNRLCPYPLNRMALYGSSILSARLPHSPAPHPR